MPISDHTAYRTRHSATLPATCNPGDLYTDDSGGSVGLYACVITNTWVGPFGIGNGTVTSVSGTSPIASSGGATPAISLNDTAVTPGSFTFGSFTVDQKGRLTVASSGSVPYDLACQVVGAPTASAVVLRFIAIRAFTLSASGQRATAGTGATAQTDFIVAVNGVTKATLRFAIAGVTITVVGGTAATIAAGDIITITSPASPDATLADIGFTLTGVLI